MTSSPSKARFPESISKSTHPNAKISVRRSTARPFACSGDIYAAVPRMTPAFVAAMLARVGESEATALAEFAP